MGEGGRGEEREGRERGGSLHMARKNETQSRKDAKGRGRTGEERGKEGARAWRAEKRNAKTQRGKRNEE
jgi:hypothetical protein